MKSDGNESNGVAGCYVSIVVVNSNGRSDTLNCLQSIYSTLLSFPFEVILVDNISDESIFTEVEKIFPEVRYLNAPCRQGFAKNYNLGMRTAIGEFIMILNNDTIVRSEAIQELVRFLQVNPSFGMAGPLLVSLEGQPLAESARRRKTFWDFLLEQIIFDLGMPLGKIRDRLRQRVLQKRTTGLVECISGACMLVRREALEAVGYLDERYDFYFEDIEWCRRFIRMGYDVGYVSEAIVVHLGDRSSSKVRFWTKQSEFFGALLYFFEQGEGDRVRIVLLKWAVVVGYMLRAVGFSALGRFSSRRNQAAVYWKLLDWLKGVPVSALAAAVAGSG